MTIEERLTQLENAVIDLAVAVGEGDVTRYLTEPNLAGQVAAGRFLEWMAAVQAPR
jgi:hypothetical protein